MSEEREPYGSYTPNIYTQKHTQKPIGATFQNTMLCILTLIGIAGISVSTDSLLNNTIKHHNNIWGYIIGIIFLFCMIGIPLFIVGVINKKAYILFPLFFALFCSIIAYFLQFDFIFATGFVFSCCFAWHEYKRI